MEHMKYAKRGESVIAQRLDDGTGWCVKGVPGQIIAEFYGDDAEQNAVEYAAWYAMTHERYDERVIEAYKASQPKSIVGGRWFPSDIRSIQVYDEKIDDDTTPFADFTDEECYQIASGARDRWDYFVEAIGESLELAAWRYLRDKQRN